MSFELEPLNIAKKEYDPRFFRANFCEDRSGFFWANKSDLPGRSAETKLPGQLSDGVCEAHRVGFLTVSTPSLVSKLPSAV